MVHLLCWRSVRCSGKAEEEVHLPECSWVYTCKVIGWPLLLLAFYSTKRESSVRVDPQFLAGLLWAADDVEKKLHRLSMFFSACIAGSRCLTLVWYCHLVSFSYSPSSSAPSFALHANILETATMCDHMVRTPICNLWDTGSFSPTTFGNSSDRYSLHYPRKASAATSNEKV